jgi:hypothetical protein
MGGAFDGTSGINRRTILKGAGAGAVVVWSAPSLLSVASRAGAAGSAACTSCVTGCDVVREPCGPRCACFADADGGCLCTGGGPCQACETHADCGAGQRCVDVGCAFCSPLTESTKLCGIVCGAAIPDAATAGSHWSAT